MFSFNEKRIIAKRVEQVLKEVAHPEMDNEHIRFRLRVYGKEPWSWADIEENRDDQKPNNLWNEISRDVMKEKP